ncbi:MAG: hypothetical protein IT450_23195 [Phycisphaerales bacterium]|nr:hypothetical protein [Phycisphaerales bacterium]
MSDPKSARGNIFEMTITQTFAGDFTLGELIHGLTPRGAILGLIIGSIGLLGGLAILLNGEFAAWLVTILRWGVGFWLAAVGLAWLVGSVAALGRSAWRAAKSR